MSSVGNCNFEVSYVGPPLVILSDQISGTVGIKFQGIDENFFVTIRETFNESREYLLTIKARTEREMCEIRETPTFQVPVEKASSLSLSANYKVHRWSLLGTELIENRINPSISIFNKTELKPKTTYRIQIFNVGGELVGNIVNSITAPRAAVDRQAAQSEVRIE